DCAGTGGGPEPGEAWKFNLCRFDYNKAWKEPELSCVAPIATKKIPPFFHQIDDYATLTFVGPDAKTAKPFGIETREPLTTSTVVGFPAPPPPFRVKRVMPGLKLDFPIMVRQIPGSSEMLVITQPAAYGPTTISRFKHGADAGEVMKLFETPDGGTAYDIAFHPKFAENG